MYHQLVAARINTRTDLYPGMGIVRDNDVEHGLKYTRARTRREVIQRAIPDGVSRTGRSSAVNLRFDAAIFVSYSAIVAAAALFDFQLAVILLREPHPE
jgi:hypothetical protein